MVGSLVVGLAIGVVVFALSTIQMNAKEKRRKAEREDREK